MSSIITAVPSPAWPGVEYWILPLNFGSRRSSKVFGESPSVDAF